LSLRITSPGSIRGPKNHHSSPPNSMCVPGTTPWIAGSAPWPQVQFTVNDWGATIRPKRLPAAQALS
jgi:hypothetical protein